MGDEQAEVVAKGEILPGVVLPDFIRGRADGIWVDLRGMGGSRAFADVVDRLFTMGVFFPGLDYPVFLRLVYDLEPGALQDLIGELQGTGQLPYLRFADGIARMDGERIALYRPLRTASGVAYYLFEPLCLEHEVVGEDGETRVEQTPAKLDADEFVCQLWVKGVRSGIDLEGVRGIIDKGSTGQLPVARTVPPTPGSDAGAGEVHTGLHRDDAPRLLDDGRVDLTVFGNRFPQIAKGARLMRKLPLALGKPGRDLAGKALPPAVPKDFELRTLAGPGTEVERTADGEFIVATRDGFLNIDVDTNQLSVTEKIIHREGVSLRTTGDLALTGEHYEEHGEILEQRTVEGRNITVLADVHGRLVSSGGEIVVGASLLGGQAFNQEGSVRVEGLTSAAQILAPRGDIEVGRVEGSVLIGRRVKADQAVHCEIIADEVEIELAEACTIEARRIRIASTGTRSRRSCVLLLRVPDLSSLQTRLEELQAQHARGLTDQAQAQHELDTLLADKEFAHFLKIFGQIKRGEVQVPPERQAAWRQVTQRWMPTLQRLAAARDVVAAAGRSLTALEEACEQQRQAMRERYAMVHCEITMVDAELSLRCVPDEGERLLTLAAGEGRALLHAHLSKGEALDLPEAGGFTWQAQPPEGLAAAAPEPA